MSISLRNVAFVGVPRRRSSGTLDTVATGLEAWYAADQLTGLSDGNAVVTWDDAKNAHDVTQGNASLRPVYKTNIINGLPVVRFTAASSHRLTGSDSGMPTGDLTFVVVVNSTDITLNTDRGIVGYGSNSFGSLATIGCAKNNGYGDLNNRHWFSQYGDAAPVGTVGGDIANKWTVFVINRTGTSYRVWSNTKAVRTKTMTTNTALGGTLALGSFIAQVNFFDGDIAEIGVYSRQLTDAEVEAAIDLMVAKYSITLFPT